MRKEVFPDYVFCTASVTKVSLEEKKENEGEVTDSENSLHYGRN